MTNMECGGKKIVKWKDCGGTTLLVKAGVAGKSKQLLGNKFGNMEAEIGKVVK